MCATESVAVQVRPGGLLDVPRPGAPVGNIVMAGPNAFGLPPRRVPGSILRSQVCLPAHLHISQSFSLVGCTRIVGVPYFGHIVITSQIVAGQQDTALLLCAGCDVACECDPLVPPRVRTLCCQAPNLCIANVARTLSVSPAQANAGSALRQRCQGTHIYEQMYRLC